MSMTPITSAAPPVAPGQVVKAWIPWLILSVFVFLWGRRSSRLCSTASRSSFPVDGLHNLVEQMPPVVAKPTAEAAVYQFNWLSATGTASCWPPSSAAW